MKGLVLWLLSGLSLVVVSQAQYRPKWPSPYVQREIFVLNLEDGYFGCQVNESTDFLQLFELSKLCDGIPQCFQGSDEVSLELKCTDRSEYRTRLGPSWPSCLLALVSSGPLVCSIQITAIPKCQSAPTESVWTTCATVMTVSVAKDVTFRTKTSANTDRAMCSLIALIRWAAIIVPVFLVMTATASHVMVCIATNCSTNYDDISI